MVVICVFSGRAVGAGLLRCRIAGGFVRVGGRRVKVLLPRGRPEGFGRIVRGFCRRRVR